MKYRIIFVILFSILVSFILGNIYLGKSYGLGDPIKYYVSPSYGYALRENQIMTRDNEHFISINNVGMRNKSDYSKSEKDNLILFFGDSVVYGGSYIDDDDTVSSKFCSFISSFKKKKFFCGNYAVNAYGITNITQRIKSVNYKLKSKFTVVLLTSGNIQRGKTSLSGQPFFMKEIKPPFRAIKEVILFYVDNFRLKSRYSLSNKLKNETYDKYYSDEKGELNENIKNFYVNEINELFETFKKNKSNHLIIYLSSKNEFLNNQTPKEKNILIERANNYKANLLIIDKFDKKQLNDIFYDNIHLTKFGHEFIAEKIMKVAINEIY